MEQNLHHPSPRLPEGWKPFQLDNVDDITLSSDLPSNTGRHSRSPSVLSNHNFPVMNVQPSQIQQQSNEGTLFSGEDVEDNDDLDYAQLTSNQNEFTTSFQQVSDDGNNSSYFHRSARSSASPGMNTATAAPSLLNQHTDATDLNSINNNLDDVYLSTNPDPSTSSPSFFLSDQTVQETLSPFAPYHNSFDAQQGLTTNNNLNLHWTHHRSLSDQSDLSSNASPFIGSVHSEHNSPFINPQPDLQFEDELHEALSSLDMGAPFEIAAQQYNNHTYDTSNLELDQQGFPIDASLFQDRQQEYYPQEQHNSRPTSSSSNYIHQNLFNQNISIPPSFQSPALPSATSIPEIEVTVAPPTPKTQAFNNLDSYFQQPQYTHPYSHSAQNSPSFAPSYIFQQNTDIAPLALPPIASGRRRAVSDSGTRPSLAMPPSGTNLVRRVSSGSHPYLPISQDGSPASSGRNTPARGHRKSFSSGHNMTHREVLDLVKNDGPREAKNPKKFVCDFPGCGQRFTRNSNKTTHMLTHKNERPHVCPHCHKDFTRQHDWKRHMELHDPSKKFRCAGTLADGRPWGCNKEFARKDALSRHFKSQQGRQCIDEVLREGRSIEEIYEQHGLSMNALSGNSSEDMYEE